MQKKKRFVMIILVAFGQIWVPVTKNDGCSKLNQPYVFSRLRNGKTVFRATFAYRNSPPPSPPPPAGFEAKAIIFFQGIFMIHSTLSSLRARVWIYYKPFRDRCSVSQAVQFVQFVLRLRVVDPSRRITFVFFSS